MSLPPIVYEDDHLIVFDKPAGLLIAPDRWDANLPNLVTLVRDAFGPELANAHRLDKETSGVVLFAKTTDVLRDLTRMFEDRAIEKRYWALVSPPPRVEAGEIAHNLAPDERKPGRMRVLPAGKPAHTKYRVAESWRGRWAAVELQPTTGRTHQLRVHLATIGARSSAIRPTAARPRRNRPTCNAKPAAIGPNQTPATTARFSNGSRYTRRRSA
ncbi:MAG: RluA family pseudouridine synthase [Pirellulales bacterium]